MSIVNIQQRHVISFKAKIYRMKIVRSINIYWNVLGSMLNIKIKWPLSKLCLNNFCWIWGPFIFEVENIIKLKFQL